MIHPSSLPPQSVFLFFREWEANIAGGTIKYETTDMDSLHDLRSKVKGMARLKGPLKEEKRIREDDNR